MKRILIFTLAYEPFVGGAEVAIREITDRLGSEYEFHMITLRFDRALPKIEKRGNILIHRLGPSVVNAHVSDRNMPLTLRLAKILFPFTSALKAHMLNRQYSYDLVWAMMANYAGFGATFFKYTHPRTPYFLELQDGRAFVEMKKRQPVLRFIFSFYLRIYHKANLIKTISHFLHDQVRSIGYKGNVEVIPNGVDVAKFSASISEETTRDLRNKFDKKMGDVFLFTASRLVLSRGVEDTIRALAFLPENVKLFVAGSGDDKEKLQKIAKESNVSERVIFVGHVDHAELPAYYRISDIFVRPSLIEGFGNSFVEAFAAGIPVVATPVGGIPDFLFDPEHNPKKLPTGLFCEVQNPESIARAVKRYIDNPALVAEITSNAKILVAEKYDWSGIARAMHERIFAPLTEKRG